MDVVVHRLTEDIVLIGDRPAGPAGVGLVPAPACEIHIDPTAPDSAPFTVVHDTVEAAHAISRVYGKDVAEAAARSSVGETELVAVHPTPGSAGFRTLGLLTWLGSWSPDLLPAGLLDLELALTALGLDDAVADHLLATAEDRLMRRADLAVTLSRRLRDDATEPSAGLAGLVAVAVPTLRGLLGSGDPYHDDVEHEDELARALRAIGAADTTLDWAMLTGIPEIGDRDLVGADNLGLEISTDPERSGSVDWYQVPRGLLDTGEETVTWSLDQSAPEPTVNVSVRAAAGAPDSDRLAFRLYTTGHALPLACGPLRRSATTAAFVGQAPVIGQLSGGLVLDVHDAVDPRPPRLGANRVSATAMRWAARAVTTLRLGGGSPGAAAVARGGLEEAARLFEAVAATHPLLAQQELARRRRARCTALVGAVLRSGGHDRMAQQLMRRWQPPTDPVTSADVAMPDLTGSGWEPSVTERALAAPARWRTL